MIARPSAWLRPIAGFSLIELMVATAIGLLLVAGSISLYSYARTSYRVSENVANLQETLQFAFGALEPDIRMAGFWGRHSDGTLNTVPAGVTVRCNATDVSAWALNIANPVEAGNDHYDLPCPAYSSARPGTDTLTLRRASAGPAAAEPQRVQIQIASETGQLFSDGVLPSVATPRLAVHDVVVHAYYIDAHSSLGDLPSLRRQTLAAKGVMHNQEIIPGIEDLQVRFGIDENLDGVIERFVDPGDPSLAAGAPVLVVQVRLIVRAEHPEPGYRDASFAGPPDGVRRLSVQRSYYLRNAGV